MTSSHRPAFPPRKVGARSPGLALLAGALLISPSAILASDIPDARQALRFGGIYKVVSSTDPMFPVSAKREFFLDFGRGIRTGASSGTVAVSLRQNPHVKVRLLAWQYFPQQGTLVIGNPTARGSHKAVVRAAWRMSGADGGAVLERAGGTVVIQRPAPGDY